MTYSPEFFQNTIKPRRKWNAECKKKVSDAVRLERVKLKEPEIRQAILIFGLILTFRNIDIGHFNLRIILLICVLEKCRQRDFRDFYMNRAQTNHNLQNKLTFLNKKGYIWTEKVGAIRWYYPTAKAVVVFKNFKEHLKKYDELYGKLKG